jgi:D-alanine--poly(phosphoribitol) ligase subunit 2
MSHTANIRRIVLACCHAHNDVSDRRIDVALEDAAPLFGRDATLDSIALVSLILAVEQDIESELGILVTLADARAASQERSPFRTVGALVTYAAALVDEESRASV